MFDEAGGEGALVHRPSSPDCSRVVLSTQLMFPSVCFSCGFTFWPPDSQGSGSGILCKEI